MESKCILRGDMQSMADAPTSVTGWNAELTELDTGRLESDVMIVHNGPLMLAEAHGNKTLHTSGEGPQDCRMFTIQLSNVEPYLNHGMLFSSREILAYPVSGELDATFSRGFHLVYISIQNSEFERLCRQWGNADLFRKLTDGGTYLPSAKALIELKRTLSLACSSMKARGFNSFTDVREDILSAFSDCFVEEMAISSRPSLSSRKRAVSKALEFIRTSHLDNIRLADICEAANVSERTMLYAFKQEVGISPKSYLKAYRLHGANKALRSNQAENVTSVAADWGFWHMGQFGADYKRLFGELPSMTLGKRARKIQVFMPTYTGQA